MQRDIGGGGKEHDVEKKGSSPDQEVRAAVEGALDRMGLGLPLTALCFEPCLFTMKQFKSHTYSSIADNVGDWLQKWVDSFQVPVKGFAFQFLPECLSGRNIPIVDSRVLKRKYGWYVFIRLQNTLVSIGCCGLCGHWLFPWNL